MNNKKDMDALRYAATNLTACARPHVTPEQIAMVRTSLTAAAAVLDAWERRLTSGAATPRATDALARFADGSATETDILAIVPTSDMIMIQVQVRRSKPPRDGSQIHLLPRKRGPVSTEDRSVVHASGPRWGQHSSEPSVWSAWWRVDSLRLWCEAWARKPENRGVVLPWSTRRSAMRGTSQTAGAGMPRTISG